jgi:hypothetical protein
METSMGYERRGLSLKARAHVAGRIAMALCIGWGYLALVLGLDIGGWGTWMHVSPVGSMVRVQLVAVLGVTFGAVGAHVGLSNVMGAQVAEHRERLAERRAAMRRWQRH